MAHSYDQTLIQRMGFADPDRRSPAHDDACIQIATESERFVRAVRELRFLRNARCELEVPLQKGEGKYASTVGFIDAIVTYEIAEEDYSINASKHYCKAGFGHERCMSTRDRHLTEISKAEHGNYPFKDEVVYDSWTKQPWAPPSERVMSAPPPIRGLLLNADHIKEHVTGRDLHADCFGPIPASGPANLSWRIMCALVEVKTKIANIGDLLRQMNLYREYKKTHKFYDLAISDYVIWSLDPADIRFAKLLAQQGYTLIAGPLP